VLGEKDSHKVVIDEYCGYLTAMTTIPITLTSVAAGFFIFRLFDILKVQPGRWAERNLPGGVGVVMDDVVAGIYTNIVLNLGLFAFRKGIF
jgi:phosphatidylglycerophosphatase A